MPAPPKISVVIPVRNEEGTVEELARRLQTALPAEHEVLFVDDGSSDSTWSRLDQLHDPNRLRLLKLRAPSGKSAALMAGFARTRAPTVFTLDGDLQDDPDEIPKFLAKMEEGFDLVSGWKRVRRDPWHKVLPSRIFNAFMRRATRIELHDMNCGFKCYRGDLARSLRIYGDQHRFIPVFAVHRGFRVAEVEIRHHPRRHGRSKYGVSRLVKGFLDLGTVLLRTRYRGHPAHFFGGVALACALGAGILAVPALARLVPRPAALPALLAAGMFAVTGIVFLAAGWLAEVQLDSGTPDPGLVLPDVEIARD